MLLCRFHLGMIWVQLLAPVACAIATELGTPSARGPQPPFSSLEAEAQALPKAIPNKVQALSTGVSPTLPALPKAKATTANARGCFALL